MSAEEKSLHDDAHAVHTEKEDVEPRSITRFGLLLVAVTLGAMLILVPFFRLLDRYGAEAEPEPGPLAWEGARQPPAPRLQVNPADDLAALHAEEQQLLTTYDWVDRDAGVVRIPVERAMELIAERGVPEPAPLPSPSPEPAPGGGAR